MNIWCTEPGGCKKRGSSSQRGKRFEAGGCSSHVVRKCFYCVNTYHTSGGVTSPWLCVCLKRRDFSQMVRHKKDSINGWTWDRNSPSPFRSQQTGIHRVNLPVDFSTLKNTYSAFCTHHSHTTNTINRMPVSYWPHITLSFFFTSKIKRVTATSPLSFPRARNKQPETSAFLK